MPEPATLPPAARDAILAWYDRHGRRLPFRRTTDPYAILVSEAMAQQTQAERAGDAWKRFMARFPTISALASASPADVLREWRGLGYNRRAVSLWRAAGVIIERHGGRVPTELAALEALPGVGPYTARAVAAIAFGQAVGAVDTNVRKVLGRMVIGDADVLGPADMQALADAAVPPGRAADWTHALMDVGATVCRPRRPDCISCPALAWCRFAAQGQPGDGAGNRTGSRRIPRAAAPRFASTSRWIRGRIVDRLRSASDGAWTLVDGPIGEHDREAVAAALAALAREGLVELAAPARADDGAGRLARLSMS